MRNMPGWVAGAVGVSAIVGAFYLGGRVTASANESTAAALPIAARSAAPAVNEATEQLDELAVECEPGQRAVVRTSRDGAPPQVACVSDPRPVTRQARAAYAPAVVGAPDVARVSDSGDRPYARPAVITEPVEVYRPRSRPVTYGSRDVRPQRSVKKSVAIIGGSTAAGAVVGGLVKGKKGAVIGGLLGGGAATVWDQVTRRRDADIR